ncbi:hypothetical protein V6N13_068787 [Hibiscus sabdariffa]
MHWKGLWYLFARHGEVNRAFIAKKLSRGGKRFGFVSFEMVCDASRAMERLNGFNVYGYRLTVKFANQNKWRASGKHNRDQLNIGENELRQPRINQTLRDRSQQEVHKKKVLGHVVDEDLWKLQRCLIGEMASVCSVQSIVNRLEQWGLNGIKVQRIGGKVYLLSFEDEDLYIMLEDLEWSYLKEIFCKVEEWSVKLKSPPRATWIEVRGVPLHAWNYVTLKRIVEIWGNFEAWGVNANRILNSESMTILITMGYSRRIEETILVEIGSEIHEISVLELGFKDDTVDPLTQTTNAKASENPAPSESEDSSESLSEEEQMSISGKELSKGDVERESLNEMGAGKEDGVCFEQPFGNLNSHQGIVAGHESPGKSPKISGENDIKTVEEKVNYRKTNLGLNVRSWAEVLSTDIQDQSTIEGGTYQKMGQECLIGNDRNGVNNLGLSAKEGVGVLKDREIDTIQMDLSGAEDKHHEGDQVRDQFFEVQGDLDNLNSFREMESEFLVKNYRAAKKYEPRPASSSYHPMFVRVWDSLRRPRSRNCRMHARSCMDEGGRG